MNESGQALLWADDFMDMTTDLWEIPTESARRVGHPAPFPVELPKRLIELYTYPDELVLDPFMGAGSTAVAALRVGRHYVGYDTEAEYIDLANAASPPSEKARAELYRGPKAITLPAAPAPPATTRTPCLERCERGARPRTSPRRSSSSASSDRSARTSRPPRGVEVDFIALDVDDNEWWFDVSGAFTSTRPGLQRTDTLWKAIGRAAVVHAAIDGGPRYVLLTTDAPRKGSAGAKALKNVVGSSGPIHAVIELLDESDWQRLRDFALGVDTATRTRPVMHDGR